MKCIHAAAFAILFQLSARAEEFPLNGFFETSNPECLSLDTEKLHTPYTLYVRSNQSEVSIFALINAQGKIGYQNLLGYGMLVGTKVEKVMGDGSLKREGLYGDHGGLKNSFQYSELANSSQDPFFREVRSVQLDLAGDTLHLMRSGSVSSHCVFTRISGPASESKDEFTSSASRTYGPWVGPIEPEQFVESLKAEVTRSANASCSGRARKVTEFRVNSRIACNHLCTTVTVSAQFTCRR